MRWLTGLLALALIALSVWRLEADRTGLEITPLAVEGSTPATLYLKPGSETAPAVVIAHGFAGSRQLMEPFALTLAQAGYVVASFDFEGHGRNPRPMSGDVGSLDGTTRLLMDETARVAEAVLVHPRADGRLAYLGHSMASDIVVRQSMASPPGDAVVAISMFSRAVTEDAPQNLLVIAGQWEARLAEEALNAARLTDPSAEAFQTLGDPAAGTGRRAVIVPMVEHVGVLYAPTSLREARAWLDAVFERESDGPVPVRGGWILLGLASIVALAWPLARALPRGGAAAPVPMRRFLLAALLPALAVPLSLWPVEVDLLPVLVADYLALHMGLYGVILLAILGWGGHLRGAFPPRVWWIGGAIALFGIALLGGFLDRYAASFLPHPGRLAVIGGLALGAVPFMLGEAVLTGGGTGPLWRVMLARGAFLGSLMIAVALDFDGLLFLLIILPVILLFFALFGTMSGWVGRRTGLPAAGGLGLGLVLAWALGVTFPMFDAG